MEKLKKMNGTYYSLPSASLPHFKKPQMPEEQREKLLAMHKASRANAGIYVAVVLAVYVILLTILLCRYARRQGITLVEDSDEENGRSGSGAGGGLLRFSTRKLRRLRAVLCCYHQHHHHHHHHHTATTSTEHPLTRLTEATATTSNTETTTRLVVPSFKGNAKDTPDQQHTAV